MSVHPISAACGGAAVLAAVIGVAGFVTLSHTNGRASFEGSALVRPEGYDEWPLAGALLGLSYSADAGAGHSDTFHRVYINPAAYRAFLKTGTFPEGTTLVLELYEQQQQLAAPARSGRYEGRRVAIEASVKDTSRFAEGWGYFDFGNGATRTATAFDASRCQSCHIKHGAVDSVFVQFYPRLRDAIS